MFALCFASNQVWAAEAESESSNQPLLKNVQVEQMPTVGQFMRFYPPKAMRAEVTGAVVLRCTVSAELKPDSCAVVSEDPAGYDFGAAAVRLASLFKLKPKTADGLSVVGGVWQTRIAFRIARQ
jgi:periplasmic protein TonB